MKKLESEYSCINQCRLCESNQLIKIIDFGSVPLGNNLQKSIELSKNVSSYDLVVMNCKNCNHFQLNTAVSQTLLYATNYTYLSGTGISFVNHIKDYVSWALKKTQLLNQGIIIDIGSNDGTCLKQFQRKKHIVCGVDPAKIPSDIAIQNGVPTINKFFNKKVADEIVSKYGQVDIVTSQNALAHIDDLKSTFENIYNILKNRGFFVFEVGYFKKVLELMQFDTIYHEHIDYHHAGPLAKFLSKLGFDIIEINENKIQGGSLRFLLQKSNKQFISNKAKAFLTAEKQTILYNEAKMMSWSNDINSRMKNFRELYFKLKSKKDICFAYGAPTKATLFLKMSGLNENDIDFVVDDNKFKVGRYMPQIGVQIKSSNNIECNKSALILLFAWNFAEDIIENLKKQYKVPVTVIVPFPLLRVIEI